MINNPTIKAKADAMSAMMRDKNLSRIISDAWTAPPGSTANDKAKNILKSFQITNSNFAFAQQDGKGGNGEFDYPSVNVMEPPKNNTPMSVNQETPMQSMDIPEPPKPSQYQISESIDDGVRKDSPALGDMADYTVTAEPWYKNMFYKSEQERKKALGNTYEEMQKRTTSSWKKSILDKWEKYTPNTMGGLLMKEAIDVPGDWINSLYDWGGQASSWATKKGIQATDYTMRHPAAFINWMKSPVSENKSYKEVLDELPTAMNYFYGDSPEKEAERKEKVEKQEKINNGEAEDEFLGWTQEQANEIYLDFLNNDFKFKPEAWNGIERKEDITEEMKREKVKKLTGFNPIEEAPEITETGDKTVADLENLGDAVGNEALRNWYEPFDASMKAYYKLAYEAALSGRGRDSFYRDAFSDNEFMESLGVPQEIIDTLPKSGILAEHLVDLKKTVKSSHGLDELERKIVTTQEQGMTLEDDMKAYIRSKDENLAQIEKLIDDTENKILNMDTSNPYVAKRMDNYLKYLNIIQGRTNQRYVDLLDSSAKTFERRQQMLENRYNSSFARASEDYKDLSAISTEAYNDIKGQLDRIYDVVDMQSENYESMSSGAIARITSAENLRKIVLDNDKRRLEIRDHGLGDSENLDWKDVNSLLGAEKDKDGLVSLMIKDPITAWNRANEAGGTAKGYNPETIVSMQQDWLEKYLKQEIKSGNMTDSVQGIYSDLVEAKDLADKQMAEIGKTKMTPTEKKVFDTGKFKTEQMYKTGLERIEAVTQRAIRDSLVGNPSFTSNIRDAIKDLSGIRTKLVDKDKGKFVRNWGEGKLGDQVAGLLFDHYHKSIAAANGELKHDEVFQIKGVPMYKIPNDLTITNKIAKSISDSVLQTSNINFDE